jgi:hypothetical protein
MDKYKVLLPCTAVLYAYVVLELRVLVQYSSRYDPNSQRLCPYFFFWSTGMILTPSDFLEYSSIAKILVFGACYLQSMVVKSPYCSNRTVASTNTPLKCDSR